MRPSPRSLLMALGLTMSLVAGCSSDSDLDRHAGDPVTADEAGILAELLHRNFSREGADFVITAPYADDAVLTLTGAVDFRNDVGRAQAVTTFGDESPEDTRTVFFGREDLWFGDVPGLPQALAADGAPGKTFLRRAVTTGSEDVQPQLLDVLLEILLDLSSPTADDPRAFLDGSCTWEGQRSIDSRLTSLFGLSEGRTVAVAAAGDVLTQFVTPLAEEGFEVTVTLADHGRRVIEIPAAEATAEAADHPGITAGFAI
jgi:hypothetical protein